MVEFELKPRELKALKIGDIPERHRLKIKAEIESHARSMLGQLAERQKAYAEAERKAEELQRQADEAEEAAKRAKNSLSREERLKLLDALAYGKNPFGGPTLLEVYRALDRVRVEKNLLESEKARAARLAENPALALKTAVALTMNNFTNRFPSHPHSSRYPEIRDKIAGTASTMGINLGKWMEEKNALDENNVAYYRHYMKVWPLFVKMLHEINDYCKLTS